ncbi:hypothetical protein [Mariprofundus ferrooxydans]|uniref:hypothetical protein n=1 Tax=Mariprofundus ferrooxydans TaxID=314344 RepID=UPI00143214CC|nr:hypothetical protein [Mariprofundus ferrooxydans]
MKNVKAIAFRIDANNADSTRWEKIGEGELEISGDRLEYGGISIPYESISDAVLNENSKDGMYKTLYVNTDIERFMFNLVLDRGEDLELPFAVVNTEGGPLEIKSSMPLKILVFSLMLFVILTVIGISAK